MKLIIFDLDDTLIDTSGSFLGIKLRQALRAMIQAGLPVSSEEDAYGRLIQINQEALNGKETLYRFLEEVDGLDFLEEGCQAYYRSVSGDFTINPLPGAKEVLGKLHERWHLAIVSTGDEQTQLLKIMKAGIPKEWFVQIIFTFDYDKKKQYQYFLESGYQPQDILVCGDKYDGDLRPARDLGMGTVHMQWGRGKKFPPPSGAVDYSIHNLYQILDIAKNLDIVKGLDIAKETSCKPLS